MPNPNPNPNPIPITNSNRGYISSSISTLNQLSLLLLLLLLLFLLSSSQFVARTISSKSPFTAAGVCWMDGCNKYMNALECKTIYMNTKEKREREEKENSAPTFVLTDTQLVPSPSLSQCLLAGKRMWLGVTFCAGR